MKLSVPIFLYPYLGIISSKYIEPSKAVWINFDKEIPNQIFKFRK